MILLEQLNWNDDEFGLISILSSIAISLATLLVVETIRSDQPIDQKQN